MMLNPFLASYLKKVFPLLYNMAAAAELSFGCTFSCNSATVTLPSLNSWAVNLKQEAREQQ